MTDSPSLSIWMQPTDPGEFALLRDPLRQQQAIGRILTRYAPALTRLGRQRGLRADDIDEIRQYVIADLLNALPHFRYNQRKGGFRNYLRRCWFNAKTRYDHFVGRSLPSCGHDVETLVEICTRPDNVAVFVRRAEAKYQITQSWELIQGRLNARDRKLCVRVLWDGENRDAVAAELGMSRANADQVICRTRRWLKEVLPTRTGRTDDDFLPSVPPLD